MNTTLSASGHDLTPLSDEEKQQRAEHLTDEERRILLNQGTEPPFCGGLLDNKEDGVYYCKLCELPLFAANAKFESGTGWPSFFAPIADRVGTKRDFKMILPRTEYHCARCSGHQGHVFKDGPAPTGLRYCNNGVALRFAPKGDPLPDLRT